MVEVKSKKIKINRINHITLPAPVEKEKEIRLFYEEVLGFKEIDHPKELDTQYKVIWYDQPNLRLHIDMSFHFTQAGIERHFGVEVDDIQLAREFDRYGGKWSSLWILRFREFK